MISFSLGDYDNVLGLATKTLELNPKLPEAMYNLAVLLEINGRERESLVYYHKLVKTFKYEEFAK